jgi:hypothetical protein
VARADVTRWAAVAATAAALGVAAWQLPGELRSYDNAAAAAAARPHDFPVTALVGIDPEALGRAAELLPRDAVFFVAVQKQRDLRDLVFQSLAPDALLPRRRTDDVQRAMWILAYRVDPRTLGIGLRRVTTVGADVAVAEVAR